MARNGIMGNIYRRKTLCFHLLIAAFCYSFGQNGRRDFCRKNRTQCDKIQYKTIEDNEI